MATYGGRASVTTTFRNHSDELPSWAGPTRAATPKTSFGEKLSQIGNACGVLAFVAVALVAIAYGMAYAAG